MTFILLPSVWGNECRCRLIWAIRRDPKIGRVMPVYIRRTCSSLTLTQVDHSAISAASSMCVCPSKSCLNGFGSEGCTDINKRRGGRQLGESHLVSRKLILSSYPNLAVVLLTITFKAPYLSQPVSDSGFICPRTTLPAPFLSAYRQYTPTALCIQNTYTYKCNLYRLS